jgi:hypothetical protein
VSPRIDSNWVEPAGRSWLTAELFHAGLDVARPELDRGIDLTAYLHLDRRSRLMSIQMKAASKASFGLEAKYERIPKLILAYVWGLEDYAHIKCFALNYSEALQIMKEQGYTKSPSWKKGGYSTSTPSEELRKLLAPFEMTHRKWRRLFDEVTSQR